MSDCAACGLPPCTCRCGLVDLAAWSIVLMHLQLAQRMQALTPWAEATGAGVVHRRRQVSDDAFRLARALGNGGTE